ncbi:phagocytic receptor [Musa troglodytarum]|uniref:Transmembrane 9 superfamily member n=1 Tax=Musa troglodytarum TaxID=320322 RepID=A0A9E7GGC9_9LILI|nr:phagocytic receptor [Musa troglodytarum]
MDLVRVAALLLCFGVAGVVSEASDHRYKQGTPSPCTPTRSAPSTALARRIGSLIFPSAFQVDHVTEKKEALGEVLNGDRLVAAPYKLDFRVDYDSELLCKKKLTKGDVAKFRDAVMKDYYFQMYYDDLPIWGFIGKVDKEGKDLSEDKYADDEESAEDQEETGWKDIHGDVFRFPKNKSLLAASLGSGTQLFALTVFIFVLALVGVFYPDNRGVLFTALVVICAHLQHCWIYCYVLVFSTRRNKLGKEFALDGCLFCGPLFITFSFLNTVAVVYSATAALPFGTIVVIVLIWTLVTSPLPVLGGIAGKNNKTEFQAPCRTTKFPREIPPLPWYQRTIPQMAMAGFLPFSAIYIELYYIFASVWGDRIYIIHGILFVVFIILLIVTAFVTVAFTYFQLAAEDHEWWWRSFLCGGSTGLFVYGYCLYYYFARSDMSGFMQTSFFFRCMACICYGFFLMLGMIGFRAALFFVRHICRSIKCE